MVVVSSEQTGTGSENAGGVNRKIQQCGVCARWTRDGDNFESGHRDPHTGITPCDNFVCWRCQREAKANSFVRQQIAGIVKSAA